MGLRKRENRSRAITTALKQIDKQLKTENICQRLKEFLELWNGKLGATKLLCK